MFFRCIIPCFLTSILVVFGAFGRLSVDSVPQISFLSDLSLTSQAKKENNYSLDYRYLIFPVACIGYGVGSFYHYYPKQIDAQVRQEVLFYRPDRTKLDNYTQYTPAVLTYGLNLAGIKGRHSYRDLTIIYLSSQIFTGLFTIPIKMNRLRERPDFSNYHSFPSGHTTTAFSSGQLLFREYQNTHLWIGIAGSTFAFFTGICRISNNKHWLSDVVAGAGIGILSTELAYAVYPTINKLLTKKKSSDKKTLTYITPVLGQQGVGVHVLHTF